MRAKETSFARLEARVLRRKKRRARAARRRQYKVHRMAEQIRVLRDALSQPQDATGEQVATTVRDFLDTMLAGADWRKRHD